MAKGDRFMMVGHDDNQRELYVTVQEDAGDDSLPAFTGAPAAHFPTIRHWLEKSLAGDALVLGRSMLIRLAGMPPKVMVVAEQQRVAYSLEKVSLGRDLDDAAEKRLEGRRLATREVAEDLEPRPSQDDVEAAGAIVRHAPAATRSSEGR